MADLEEVIAYSIPEVARRLSLSRRTVERLISKGHLRAWRPMAGSDRRVSDWELRRYVRERERMR